MDSIVHGVAKSYVLNLSTPLHLLLVQATITACLDSCSCLPASPHSPVHTLFFIWQPTTSLQNSNQIVFSLPKILQCFLIVFRKKIQIH